LDLWESLHSVYSECKRLGHFHDEYKDEDREFKFILLVACYLLVIWLHDVSFCTVLWLSIAVERQSEWCHEHRIHNLHNVRKSWNVAAVLSSWW